MNTAMPLIVILLLACALAFAASAQPDATKDQLQGKRVAILVADGFEQSELMDPRNALEAAGAKTSIVSPEEKSVKGWNDKEWGKSVPVDVPLASAKADQFDALLLPGGVMNPDKLRMTEAAVKLVKAFVDAGKPVAAICHGPWTLVEADAVRGRKLTSWPSLKTDIRNAGGTWTDEAVVVDKRLVTSRKPADIPAFNREMIRAFAAKT
jgi:protease I